MKQRLKFCFFTVELVIFILFTQQSVNAQFTSGTAGNSTSNQTGAVTLQNPIGAQDMNANILVRNIINAILGVVGSLALLMFVYGGFTWMLSSGSPQKVEKGKDILLWATIGLMVIFSAYAMVNFVFTSFIS